MRTKTGVMTFRLTRAPGILVFVVSSIFLLCSCGSSTLTRGKAKEVIGQSDNYKLQKRWISLNPKGPEINACVTAGYLQWASKWPDPAARLTLTEKGKQFLDSASGKVFAGSIMQQLAVMPSVPIRPYVIEITGITDGENASKVVEYKWNWDYDAQPRELKDMLFKSDAPQLGKATLKLYDDGWRVVKFE